MYVIKFSTDETVIPTDINRRLMTVYDDSAVDWATVIYIFNFRLIDVGNRILVAQTHRRFDSK